MSLAIVTHTISELLGISSEQWPGELSVKRPKLLA